MSKKRAKLTDLLNELTFRTIYDKFKLLAISAFEWENLPDGIEGKYIEQTLFDHGKAIFFRDPDQSYMCLEAQDGAQFNVYGMPLNYWACGFGYHKQYHVDDCVIIENNELRRCTHDFIMHFANKLAEAERTMDVNVKANKTPYIIACDDKDVLTFKRIFQQIDGNTPAIFADRSLNLDALEVLQTNVKFLCNDLMDYKKSVENELFTFLGINNSPIDKKERTNVPEVTSNNQLIDSFAQLQLAAREKACKAINEMYGLNISVKRREEAIPDVTESDDVLDDEADARIA